MTPNLASLALALALLAEPFLFGLDLPALRPGVWSVEEKVVEGPRAVTVRKTCRWIRGCSLELGAASPSEAARSAYGDASYGKLLELWKSPRDPPPDLSALFAAERIAKSEPGLVAAYLRTQQGYKEHFQAIWTACTQAPRAIVKRFGVAPDAAAGLEGAARELAAARATLAGGSGKARPAALKGVLSQLASAIELVRAAARGQSDPECYDVVGAHQHLALAGRAMVLWSRSP